MAGADDDFLTITQVPGKGILEFNWDSQIIHAEGGINELTAQELINAVREAEAATGTINYTKVANASGKDPLTGSISIGITVTLLEDWKIYSDKSSGFFTVSGGNIIRHDATSPFVTNPAITYQQILIQGGVIAQTNGGSGLSVDEHNKLMSIPDAPTVASNVWNTGLTSQTWSANTFATWVKSLLTRLQFIAGA